MQYDTGWVTKRVPFGEEVTTLAYHEEKDAYIVGTGTTVDFKLPGDEFHSQWSLEGGWPPSFVRSASANTSRNRVPPSDRTRFNQIARR